MLYNKGMTVSEDVMDYIRKHFSYDHNTGVISRDDRRNSGGSLDKDGYLIIKIKKRQYKAHRLAWFLYYGVFPEKELDHINRVRTDNRIANLREADRVSNNNNTLVRQNADTGVVGVYKDKTKGLKKSFATRISGKTHRFYTLEEAVDFRLRNNKRI